MNYKIGQELIYNEPNNAYDGYKGIISYVGEDYIVISNGRSSLIVTLQTINKGKDNGI